MKTSKNLIGKVASFENLHRAYLKARKGKSGSAEALLFGYNLETELLLLQRELLGGDFCTGKYRNFTVFEPKRRVISALPFRDRVAQHAICAIIEPIFERKFIAGSYACRKGKGTHKAVRRLKAFISSAGASCQSANSVGAAGEALPLRKGGSAGACGAKAPYVLKCDIRKYFASVDHGILKKLVRRKIGCRALLAALDNIIDSFRQGIPIGNLTSQLFANIYLTELDHHITGALRQRRYLRYMDDFVLVSCSKKRLHEAKGNISSFLGKLGLALHGAKAAAFPAACGTPFLGYVVRATHTTPKRRTVMRFVRRMKAKIRGYGGGRLPFPKLLESFNSWGAYLSHSRSFLLGRSICANNFRNVM